MTSVQYISLFANQDNGSIISTLGIEGSTTQVLGGDGGVAMIDYKSDPDLIYYYFSSQRATTIFRTAVHKVSGLVIESGIVDPPHDASFVPVTELSPIDQKKFAIGGNVAGRIMLTEDRGDSYTSIVAFPTTQGRITAMSWSSDGRKLYAAANGFVGEVTRCDLAVLAFATCRIPVSVSAQPIAYLASDPIDTNRVVAISASNTFGGSNPNIYESIDGGITWNDITTAGSLIDKAYNGQSVVFVSNGSSSFLLAGTSNGIFVRTEGNWSPLAKGLPTVPIFEMVYSPENDILIIGTLGRGVWFLSNAFNVVSRSGDDIATAGFQQLNTKMSEGVSGKGIIGDSISQSIQNFSHVVPPEDLSDEDLNRKVIVPVPLQ